MRAITKSSLFLLALVVLVVLDASVVTAVARQLPPSGLPSTRRVYTLQVEQLKADPDASHSTPVLVSAVEETSMTLRLAPGHTCASGDWESGEGLGATLADLAGDANDITFDDNFNPMWYYALRRRGFENLEWSGCGGKWRPEWSDISSVSPSSSHGNRGGDASSAADAKATHDLAAVKHALSHHGVCTFSSVSFCAAARRRSAQSQFQWAAQFISTLTSSPLSWRSNTPRHIRPTGVLAVAPPLNDSVLAMNPGYLDGRDGRPQAPPRHLPGLVKTEELLELEEETTKWCSYHLVYRDTLCTQHISPVLNGGRSGSGVQEGLPPGLFKAVVPSLPFLFATPFHQFHFRARQTCSDENALVLTMTLRMSFVLRYDTELVALADHWAQELPALHAQATKKHHNELHVVVGPDGVPAALQEVLTPLARHGGSVQNLTQTHTEAAVVESSTDHAGAGDASCKLPWEPEVRYSVAMNGKDHGFYTLELVPAAVLSATLNVPHQRHAERHADNRTAAATLSSMTVPTSTLRAGDVVSSLVLLPLHLLRPELHVMESLEGSTVLDKAHVDTSADTIAMVLRTTVTQAHITAYEAAYQASQQPGAAFGPLPGLLLARFPLEHGWAGLRDAPRDAESFRTSPQPVVSITRCRGPAEIESVARGALDHSESIAALMHILPQTQLSRSQTAEPPTHHNESETCRVMWLRSTMVSGSYIPAPDPAMLFNSFALGLVGLTLGIGAIARALYRLFSRECDKETVLGPSYEAEWKWRDQWRRGAEREKPQRDEEVEQKKKQ